jgi:hypothetical protein
MNENILTDEQIYILSSHYVLGYELMADKKINIYDYLTPKEVELYEVSKNFMNLYEQKAKEKRS